MMSSQEQCTWAVYWAQVGLVGHILGPNWWLVVTLKKTKFQFQFFTKTHGFNIVFALGYSRDGNNKQRYLNDIGLPGAKLRGSLRTIFVKTRRGKGIGEE
jgi:hypothetical protein